MCAPTFRGGAYLAASVFIYRSILLIVHSISCAITGYKMTYLNLPFLDEFMLHLIYFIPLFTSGGFALMGIEELPTYLLLYLAIQSSFNFVFYSSLSLMTTLFIRYTSELAYIYAHNWSAFRLKTPSLFLNIFIDFIFVTTLFIYAYQELRDPAKAEKAKIMYSRSYTSSSDKETGTLVRRTRNGTTGTSTPGSPPGPLYKNCSTPTNNSNIHNEFERKTVKNSNLEAAATASRTTNVSTNNSSLPGSSKAEGIGHGAEPGEALHYPITPVNKKILMKPLPPLPAPVTLDESMELDDISLPPPIPLASPEFDDVQ